MVKQALDDTPPETTLTNLRAVGGSATRLYRAAAPFSGAKHLALLDRLGVRLVIDLRDQIEVVDELPLPTRRVAIYGDSLDGPPTVGSLGALYRRILEEHGDRVAEAATLIARAEGGVLVHCAAGKDRTGVVIAVVLAAVGVGEDDIVADYALSGPLIRPVREAEVERMLGGLGLDERLLGSSLELHLDSPANIMRELLATLRSRHGGAAAYLVAHGFDRADLTRLREVTGMADR